MIALLVNSKAGKSQSLKISGYITEQLILKNISHKNFIDQWPDELISFSEVWIIGGDGTINYFLNKYYSCKLPIAVFKGGTGNDIAWKMYGDRDNAQILDHLLQCKNRWVDAGVCNNRYFINGIGIGFDGEVLKRMKSIRIFGGHLGYLLVVLQKIISFREISDEITIDGKAINEKLLLLLVFNSSRTGGGFYVAPQASINDGFLNFIFCKPLSVLKRLKYLPVIEKGKHLHLPFIIHNTCCQIDIKCSQEVPAQCDGDLIFSDHFSIKILPAHFLFRY